MQRSWRCLRGWPLSICRGCFEPRTCDFARSRSHANIIHDFTTNIYSSPVQSDIFAVTDTMTRYVYFGDEAADSDNAPT